MTKVFALLAVIQTALIGYFLSAQKETSVKYQNEKVVKVYEEIVEPEAVEEKPEIVEEKEEPEKNP